MVKDRFFFVDDILIHDSNPDMTSLTVGFYILTSD